MPILHVLLDNSELGKISREQISAIRPVWQTELVNPDFAAYAESCGGRGFRVTSAAELPAVLAEALVARIVADFAAGADPVTERAWIAEVGGARAGSVLCTRRDETTAQLRLLLVEPAFRGQGLGGRLIDECLAFARSAGYVRIALWTNDALVDARRLYERAGFALDEEGRHTSFGRDLVEQTWSRPL